MRLLWEIDTSSSLSIIWHVDRWQRSFRISLAKPARTIHSRKPCLGIVLRNTSSKIVAPTHLRLREGFSECDSRQAFGKYGVSSADQWIMWTNKITSMSSEQVNWDRQIPQALLAIRTSPNQSKTRAAFTAVIWIWNTGHLPYGQLRCKISKKANWQTKLSAESKS
jgi:hypothetical protein